MSFPWIRISAAAIQTPAPRFSVCVNPVSKRTMTENGNNLYFSKNMARVSVIFFFFNVRTFNIFDLIIVPLEYFNLCQNISEQLFVNKLFNSDRGIFELVIREILLDPN